MNFRTTWDIAALDTKLNHGDKVVLMGSCFSENIGAKLSYFGFDVLVNPFGTLFHPLPLAALLDTSQNSGSIRTLNQQNDWYTYEAHSEICGSSEMDLLKKFDVQKQLLSQYLEQSKMLIITLGSAWGYYIDGEIVANCHKMPSQIFEKKLSAVDVLHATWQKTLAQLKIDYPNLHVVFTVSPVRHTRDGFVENQRSKSRLIELVHQLNTSYFPAYEIQMDDLRDYRFYEADLIHPNTVAVDYIFDKFSVFALSEKARMHFSSIHKFRMFEAHRLLSNDPKRQAQHEQAIEEKREQLLNEIAGLRLK